ncbi:NUDIX domain-containing protein [Candidatus Microgenomates bacterium]|nr:NUDIX domain-containing protein [Candidatus Microgenomates bacterium]
MAKQSAGILLYKQDGADLKLLLAHPGGPFWASKDAGVWSIPKGEYGTDEPPLAAALREFTEETGLPLNPKHYLDLGEVKLKSGKVIKAWGVEGDFKTDKLVSNRFTTEWPPHSGTEQSFPEIDRAEWFDPATAIVKINPSQQIFIDRLLEQLGIDPAGISPPEQAALL